MMKLPEELLLKIFGTFVEGDVWILRTDPTHCILNRRTLYAIVKTSRTFWRITEPLLCHTVHTRLFIHCDPDHVSRNRTGPALPNHISRPILGQYIKTVVLLPELIPRRTTTTYRKNVRLGTSLIVINVTPL